MCRSILDSSRTAPLFILHLDTFLYTKSWSKDGWPLTVGEGGWRSSSFSGSSGDQQEAEWLVAPLKVKLSVTLSELEVGLLLLHRSSWGGSSVSSGRLQ